jgi:hypothetical protein
MFVNHKLKDFSQDRAKTDRGSTSSLSPHVHFGEISNRHIYYVVRPPVWVPMRVKVMRCVCCGTLLSELRRLLLSR